MTRGKPHDRQEQKLVGIANRPSLICLLSTVLCKKIKDIFDKIALKFQQNSNVQVFR